MNNVFSSSYFDRTSARKLVDDVVKHITTSDPAFSNRVIYNETKDQDLPTEHAAVIKQILDEVLPVFLNQQELSDECESITNVCVHTPNYQEKEQTVYFLVVLDNHIVKLDPEFLDSGLPYINSLLDNSVCKVDLIYSNGNHLSIHLRLKNHNIVSLPVK